MVNREPAYNTNNSDTWHHLLHTRMHAQRSLTIHRTVMLMANLEINEKMLESATDTNILHDRHIKCLLKILSCWKKYPQLNKLTLQMSNLYICPSPNHQLCCPQCTSLIWKEARARTVRQQTLHVRKILSFRPLGVDHSRCDKTLCNFLAVCLTVLHGNTTYFKHLSLWGSLPRWVKGRSTPKIHRLITVGHQLVALATEVSEWRL